MTKSMIPICLNSKGGRGGIPGLQPSLKDRIYSVESVSTAVTTSDFFMPMYLIKIEINRRQND